MTWLRAAFATHAGILAILACFAVLYATALDNRRMFMWDEAHYAVLGRALARGEGYTEPNGKPELLRPPVVPNGVAIALLLAGEGSDTAVRMVTLVATLVAIAVVYASLFSHTGIVAATAAAVAFATFPEILRSISHLLTEIPFMAAYAGAVVLFHRGLYSDARWFYAAWSLFALALLTRYTAVLFGPTCLILSAIPFARGERAAQQRMRSLHFWAAPVAAGVLLAPIFTRWYVLFGDPLVAFKAASRQLPAYSPHLQFPVSYYLRILPSMIGWAPAALAVSAGIYLIAKGDRLATTCTVAGTLIVAWLSQYGWKEPRLVSGALPFIAILVGLGVHTLCQFGSTRRQPWIVAALAMCFLIGINLDPSYARSRWAAQRSVTLGYPSFLDAMRHVELTTDAEAILIGPNCYQIGWYADRACIPTPPQSRVADFGAALRRADYLIVVNFERGQPAYVNRQAALVDDQDIASHRAWRFRDSRFTTTVIPTRLLIERRARRSQATRRIDAPTAVRPNQPRR